MDCRQAQAQLEFERLGKDTVPGPDALAAERHLRECGVCRATVSSGREFDSQMTRAMLNVPVPAGLAGRLQAAVGAVTVLSESPVVLPRRQFSRRLLWVPLALVPLLLVGMLLMSRSTVLNEASVRELGKLDPGLLPVASSSGVTVPPGWSQRSIQFAEAPRLATVNGVKLPLLMFTASIDRRTPNCSGYLVRLPLSQWQVLPDANTFRDATVQYATFGTWVVWREGDSVVICVLQSDAHVMQRLQELVANGRQLT